MKLAGKTILITGSTDGKAILLYIFDNRQEPLWL
jgi:short-subunit dehydrogenase involved in D-alanine esterification of teichoic acids